MVSGVAEFGVAARSGTLTIDPYALGASVRIPVRGDTRNEPNEGFHLAAARATRAGLADPVGTVTIRDDD